MQLENTSWSGDKKILFVFGDQSRSPVIEQKVVVAQHSQVSTQSARCSHALFSE